MVLQSYGDIMNIALINVDSKIPNLALMKLSSFHKKRGDQVYLIDISHINFDRIYASNVFVGGSGYDLKSKLPKEIEHIMPDYDLFNSDLSIGFTSRGCIRNCKFCIVREKEGFIKEHSPMNEFVDNRFQKIIIMDGNFLASKNWKNKLLEINNKKWKVSFNQGLDLRLINDENAKLLSEVKYYDLKFRKRRLYFAWDNIKDEKIIMDGLEIIFKYIPKSHIIVYVLIGFDTNINQDLYRLYKLIDLDVKPFVMIYNNKKNKLLRSLARWINKRYYKVVSWEKYET